MLQDLGDLAGAKAAYERALKIDEASFGPDHPKVAIRVNNLGRVLQDLGDLARAKAAFERALEIFERAFIVTHFCVAPDRFLRRADACVTASRRLDGRGALGRCHEACRHTGGVEGWNKFLNSWHTGARISGWVE